MKVGFRQNMTWLHTWTGLVTAWVLFFIFVTGSAGYFDDEITRWMEPERPIPQVVKYDDKGPMVTMALARLTDVATNAEYWNITLPHDSISPRGWQDFSISWEEMPEEGREWGEWTMETLDAQTGEFVVPPETRDTYGGWGLYSMHYALHYIDRGLAYKLVGVVSMLALLAMITGIVVHKKIFKDFFTFRANKSLRSWLDAHNVVSVLALPFFVMITYSGLVFFSTNYMPAGVAALYGTDRKAVSRFFEDLYEEGEHAHLPVQPPQASIAAMVASAEALWGKDQVASVLVQHEKGEEPRVQIHRIRGEKVRTYDNDVLNFHAHSGEPLAEEPAVNGTVKVNEVLRGLHEGLFAGTALRWLYFISGLLGCAMIATGLVLWAAKRRKRSDTPGFGLRLVDALNVGTIAGLSAGVALYFCANRLLPVDMSERAAWELHILFLVWGEAVLYGFFRNIRRAWLELLGLAALAYALVPVVNWLTTDKHLGVTLAAGDWVLAGFDLTMLALAALFAVITVQVYRHWPAAEVSPLQPVVLQEAAQ